MVKAETLSGPLSSRRWCWTSIAQTTNARPVRRRRPRIILGEVDSRISDGVDAGNLGKIARAIEPLDVLAGM